MKFGELSGNIRERKNRIGALRENIPTMLDLDDKLKPIIAPEHKERAAEIAAEMRELRKKNVTDAAILAKAQSIAERYRIPLDDLHQLSLSIPYLEKQIAELELLMEKIKKADAKKFEREKDSSVSRIGQTIQKLEQARISLKNHSQAKVEVEALMQGIEQQGAE